MDRIVGMMLGLQVRGRAGFAIAALKAYTANINVLAGLKRSADCIHVEHGGAKE